MFVLHAFWEPGAGAGVWAEDSEAVVTSPSEALRKARAHPFAATEDVLTTLITSTTLPATTMSTTPTTSTTTPSPTLGERSTQPTVLHLPSLRRSPLDSPEMVRVAPRPANRSGPSLLTWTVPSVRIDPRRVGSLLDRFGAGGGPDPESDAGLDVRPAASLRYLIEIARFAADLLDRRRVLPGLEPRRATGRGADRDATAHDGGAEARWRAALTGPDAVAAHALITAMPPAFRATGLALSPSDLATEALNTMVDALARQRLASSFLPPRRGRRPARPPVVEAWLDALTGPDPEVAAEPADLDWLAEQLAPWEQAGRESAGPAQLVLRLRDPRTGAEPADWHLEFLLRSRSDPSLLVDADQVWADDGALGRWLARPREVLLAELARAQRVYPALEAGLRQSRPTELELDAEGAFGFLSQAADSLTGAGFEVLLPSWWGRKARLGLRAKATPSDSGATPSAFGRDQLCDFQWELAVGDHGLSEAEIDALVTAKAPLVQLRGEWVAVNQLQLARGLELLRREGTGQKTAAEILALALAHPDDLDLPLELTDVEAGGWLGEVLSGSLTDRFSVTDPPDGFGATLRPYQQRGLSWLAFLGRLGLGACLADDMGLGKTVQLLALEAAQRQRAEDSGPTLLLCPMSLVSNWQAEAARFAPGLRVRAHHGADRPHGEDLAAVAAASDLVVTTYATALNDIDDLAEIAWERVVLDEAQAIKNRLSRTAKAVRRLPAQQRIALTGTPVENRLAELWSILDFLNPGSLGSPEMFRARYATPIERHHDDTAAGVLRRVTRPYILRRVKTDPAIIDDLPEKIEIKQYYRLTVEQASLYQSVVDDMMERIETTTGIERRGNVLAAMTKLKQVCNHPAQLLHDRSPIGRRSGKLIRLEEILEEILAEGDRVLCFTQFTEFAELLLPHLAARFDTDIAYLSGKTTRERRAELVDRFQSGEGPPVFLLSLKAGGTGLNLTAANHVLHLDRWWNPAVENQATDRAFRIGQKRSVQVRKFVGTGTLEERIDELIDDKQALANLVVGDGESWLTELSTGQLRELFALSKDAIGE